ncbi:hypothetical protein FRC06_011568, partial [Ceratobasidium sp. 370]
YNAGKAPQSTVLVGGAPVVRADSYAVPLDDTDLHSCYQALHQQDTTDDDTRNDQPADSDSQQGEHIQIPEFGSSVSNLGDDDTLDDAVAPIAFSPTQLQNHSATSGQLGRLHLAPEPTPGPHSAGNTLQSGVLMRGHTVRKPTGRNRVASRSSNTSASFIPLRRVSRLLRRRSDDQSRSRSSSPITSQDVNIIHDEFPPKQGQDPSDSEVHLPRAHSTRIARRRVLSPAPPASAESLQGLATQDDEHRGRPRRATVRNERAQLAIMQAKKGPKATPTRPPRARVLPSKQTVPKPGAHKGRKQD